MFSTTFLHNNPHLFLQRLIYSDVRFETDKKTITCEQFVSMDTLQEQTLQQCRNQLRKTQKKNLKQSHQITQLEVKIQLLKQQNKNYQTDLKAKEYYLRQIKNKILCGEKKFIELQNKYDGLLSEYNQLQQGSEQNNKEKRLIKQKLSNVTSTLKSTVSNKSKDAIPTSLDKNLDADVKQIYLENTFLHNDNRDLALEIAFHEETNSKLQQAINDLWVHSNQCLTKYQQSCHHINFLKQQISHNVTDTFLCDLKKELHRLKFFIRQLSNDLKNEIIRIQSEFNYKCSQVFSNIGSYQTEDMFRSIQERDQKIEMLLNENKLLNQQIIKLTNEKEIVLEKLDMLLDDNTTTQRQL
ncbi:hypothetical protein RFI_00944 [Reticulomyxa filosa]|uniref:Uncharacterized protein n=1 Tax=Reticulomyxa filosa TaxID=46433 RepID=X6PDI6_RETFI|nr:hypothetical protein RFI_00944 [Reticulomyxa filosa]|eukprot:ETO36119.1 hypothetical protein RFI_00944 [Reticulomyxa filosa]